MAKCSENLLSEGKIENEFGNKRLCIIGAGMSGLLATKYLLSRNLKPTVFEAKQGIGGLWRETFSSTRLQTSRHAFEFTDFPWPSHVTNQFPRHSEVLDYFQSYAMHFGLLDYVHFNSKVVEIRYTGPQYCENSVEHAGLWGKNGGPYADTAVWEVGVQESNGESTEWHHFEFLILCIGRYGDMPKIPSLPPGKGPEVFEGKVLHTLDYSALDEKSAAELIKAKKVVVIGIRKSAMDLAVECAEANQVVGNVQVCGALPYLQASLAKVWPLSRSQLPSGANFLSNSSLPDGLFSKAEEGCIHFRKSTNWGFCSKGIVLDDQTVVEADLVLFATGYDSEKNLKSLLPKIFADSLENSAVLPLYRGLIHPGIPHMTILGYPECLSNLHSTEIRTQWLAHFLSGKFVLPSIKEMEADIQNHSKHMKKITPLYSKICLDSFQIWDNDTLCRDMGQNPMRKKNWFCEFFSPYSNLDYREL